MVTRGTADGVRETVTVGHVVHPSLEAPSVPPERRMALTDFAHATRLPDGRLAVVWLDGAEANVMVGFEAAA